MPPAFAREVSPEAAHCEDKPPRPGQGGHHAVDRRVVLEPIHHDPRALQSRVQAREADQRFVEAMAGRLSPAARERAMAVRVSCSEPHRVTTGA